MDKEKVKKAILIAEPDLSKEIVDRYTDSELKEWAKLLNIRV